MTIDANKPEDSPHPESEESTNRLAQDPALPEAQQRSWPRRILNRMEVDRAVFYAVLVRYWQCIAGPITLILLAKFFEPETRGFYYTFWSVIGMQTFFEFAFPQTILTTASHQWGKLRLDEKRRIAGDAESYARLANLMRVSTLAYFVLATMFGIVVSVVGLYLFASDPGAELLSWRHPWLCLTVLSSITFAMVPCLAMLEGCDQVKQIYQLQLVRAVAGNVVVWIAIPMGAGLWTPALATLVRLVCEISVLVLVYRRFFAGLFRKHVGGQLNWRGEIWPFQWRLMAKGFFSYLNADLMMPVLFKYSSVAAGQFGMTWAILIAIRGACSSWVRARVPQMGQLVVARDFDELNRIYRRVSRIALLIMLASTTAFLTVLTICYSFSFPYAHVLLAPGPTTLLIVGMCAALIMEMQWCFIHAHGRSPYLAISLIGCVVTGCLITGLGSTYGLYGVTLAFVIMHAGVYVPMSSYAMLVLRRQWHEKTEV